LAGAFACEPIFSQSRQQADIRKYLLQRLTRNEGVLYRDAIRPVELKPVWIL
jgi:hypothetical protein